MATASAEGSPAARPLPFRVQQQRQRTRRRDHANARSTTQINRAAVPDPLLRERTERTARVLHAGWFVVGAVSLHVLLLIVAALAPRGDDRSRPDYVEPVHIQVVEPAHLELPAREPPPAPIPTVEPPRPLPLPIKKPVEAKETPPPDPIDLTPPPPTPVPPKPTRRVVGLSLESTTTGAAADAFAAGNTRMGQTSTVAEDPDKVEKLQHAYTPPRRTHVYVPPYPASLRGKGVRGEVGVQVDIDATGQVTRAVVVRPSSYDEFNAAAVDAARRCAYEPARVDGVAVARTIDINVQFQPHD
jgi:periplasmic protein TonB